MRQIFILFWSLIFLGCESNQKDSVVVTSQTGSTGTSLVVLGTIQDAGSPHIACKKECCASLFDNPDPTRMVVSLGVTDASNGKFYLFEATPDMPRQLKKLAVDSRTGKEVPDGVFLTHAHIGHYTGLQYFGKEAMNADGVAVYAMPRMYDYLSSNGPWDLLKTNGNIRLTPIKADSLLRLTPNISVTAIEVPHRDEYSETVGFVIDGPDKSALFIPDIDKWEKWQIPVETVIARVDYAFLDATFYHGEEINTRDISQIPHPFIIESMDRFASLSEAEKAKIHFIHFNHTNPILKKDSEAYQAVISNGFNIAEFGQRFQL